jgi:hypothetical protein
MNALIADKLVVYENVADSAFLSVAEAVCCLLAVCTSSSGCHWSQIGELVTKWSLSVQNSDSGTDWRIDVAVCALIWKIPDEISRSWFFTQFRNTLLKT